MDYERLSELVSPDLLLAIKNVREQHVRPIAGYDGEYGVIKTLKEGQIKKAIQNKLI